MLHPVSLTSDNCCSPSEAKHLAVRKGAWTQEEDMLLRRCIEKHGVGKWGCIAQLAGLNRCRKSCRLRWLNYLSPAIKRGVFTEGEEDLILRLHKLLGNRWSLIAGRISGRTANDVKNHWNSHLSKKKLIAGKKKDGTQKVIPMPIKPQPRTIPLNWIWEGKAMGNGSEHQEKAFSITDMPSTREQHELCMEDDHIVFDMGLNHAGSHTENNITEDLHIKTGIQNFGQFMDEEFTLEGDTSWESWLSDIDLWS